MGQGGLRGCTLPLFVQVAVAWEALGGHGSGIANSQKESLPLKNRAAAICSIMPSPKSIRYPAMVALPHCKARSCRLLGKTDQWLDGINGSSCSLKVCFLICLRRGLDLHTVVVISFIGMGILISLNLYLSMTRPPGATSPAVTLSNKSAKSQEPVTGLNWPRRGTLTSQIPRCMWVTSRVWGKGKKKKKENEPVPIQLTTASLHSRRFRLLSLRTIGLLAADADHEVMAWWQVFAYPINRSSEAQPSSRLKSVVTLRDPDVSLALLCRHNVLRAPSHVCVTLVVCAFSSLLS